MTRRKESVKRMKEGSRLKGIRNALSLTQEKFMEKTKTGNISLKETGRRKINDEDLEKIGKRFPQINIDYIRNGGEIMKRNMAPKKDVLSESSVGEKNILDKRETLKRITKILKKLGLTQVELIKEFGYSSSVMFGYYFNEKHGHDREDLFNTMKLLYPEINIDWIKTGAGKMFEETDISAVRTTLPVKGNLPLEERVIVWERIEEIVKLEKNSIDSFMKKLGYKSKGLLSGYRHGRYKILPIIRRIIHHFPKFDIQWILTGQERISPQRVSEKIKERLNIFKDSSEIVKAFFETEFKMLKNKEHWIYDPKKNDMPIETKRMLKRVFPELNIEWVLTGKGDMLVIKKKKKSDSKTEDKIFFGPKEKPNLEILKLRIEQLKKKIKNYEEREEHYLALLNLHIKE